ncbi:hypothetical protein AMATHDRAFT_137721 [Amanita thiersii Skay4041]|uniref:Major facilitator superfamily (MFS) profile domain-containing protein n=1 Tax=Amanita thiersii Skay4041 TaxID=703135 RepID=A0A2A9NT42_9AGAR|nr:hypothetical protein AMATHDRAFT_137721 [Amanita thiersii Skay4041]
MTDIEKHVSPQQIQASPHLRLVHDGTSVLSDICHSPNTFRSTISSFDDNNPCPLIKEDCLRAKLTVFGAFVALFCTFGQMNAFGTFQSWYSTHQLQHMSPSTISWIGSLQLWFFFFSGGFIGRLFDLYGPCGLMTCGTVLYLLSAVFTSLSTKYYHFALSQGILFGISVGLLFYPAIASASTHFSKYRATAIGLAAAGSSVGGVVYPIVLQALFRSVGFEWGVRISGFSSSLLCMLSVLCVTSISSANKTGATFNWNTAKDSTFILLAAGSCLVALGLFIPFFYIVDYAINLSAIPQTSFYVLAVMNAGGVFGRVAPAYVSDTIGRFNLLTPSAFLSGLSCVVLWLPARSLMLLYVFAGVYGFFSGAFISIITPCVAQISDTHEIGTRIGMLYTIISFPSLIGGPVAGLLLVRSQGSYSGVIPFSGSTIMAGSVVILCAKLAINRRLLARV